MSNMLRQSKHYECLFFSCFKIVTFAWTFLFSDPGVAAFSYEVSGPVYLEQSTGSTPLNSGDFNGDGRKDFVSVKSGGYTHILTQRADGTLSESAKMATWSAIDSNSSVSVLKLNVGDVNADGRDDIVITHSFGITIFTANSADGFARQEIGILYGSDHQIRSSCLFDINDDGYLDILTVSGNGRLYFWLNTGAGFNTQENYMLQSLAIGGPPSFGVGDFNSDGHLDFGLVSTTVGPTNASRLEIFQKAADGSFIALDPITFPAGSNISNIAVGDLNNDGRDDIALTNSRNSPNCVILVMLQTQSGQIVSYLAYNADENPASILINDMDGDGLDDLVTNHPGYSMVYTYLQQNGMLVFQPPVRNLTNNYDDPQAITSGDFNSDGCNDVIVSAAGGYYLLKGKDCVRSLPGTPSITFAKAGYKSIMVSFKPPRTLGGQPIVGYKAYCGNNNSSGSYSPILVTGLDTYTNYACSVLAVNTSGDGPRSSSLSATPMPLLSVSSVESTEGDSGAHYAIFKAALSDPAPAGGVSFDVRTSNVSSIGNAALANTDYAPISRIILLPSGQSMVDISVKIIGDKIVEPDELFSLLISKPAGLVLDNISTIGVIKNDDKATLAITKPIRNIRSTRSDAGVCAELGAYVDSLESDVLANKITEVTAISEILKIEKLSKSMGCGNKH